MVEILAVVDVGGQTDGIVFWDCVLGLFPFGKFGEELEGCDWLTLKARGRVVDLGI